MKRWMKKTLSAVLSFSMILSSITLMPWGAAKAQIPPQETSEIIQATLQHVYITASYIENTQAACGYDTVLTANYIPNGDITDLQYQWYRLDNDIVSIEEASKVKAIPGAENSTYTVTAEDIGRMLACVVTPNGDTAQAVCSDVFGKIIEVTGEGAPVIDGYSLAVWSEDAKVGSTLHAYYAYQSPAGINEGNTKIIWKRSEVPAINDGAGKYYTSSYVEEIGEGPDYTLQPEDYGKYISFEVMPVDADGQGGAQVLPQIIMSNGATQNYSAFYITPENLLANAKFVGASGNVSNNLDEEYRGIRDFKLQSSVMKYYNRDTGTYIVDAGREITFNSLFLFASNMTDITIETSLDNMDYQPFTSYTYKPGLVSVKEPVTARYIKLTFPNMTKYGLLYEIQAFLQPQSFSEIFAVEGAQVDRKEKKITQIPEGTTVSQLKAAVKGSTVVPEMEVLNYEKELVGEDEVIASGYTLKVTSSDGSMCTEYMLVDTGGMPGAVVSSIIVTPKDETLGYRSGTIAQVTYSLENPITGEADTETAVKIQWYYAPEAEGAYTPIDEAQDSEYLLSEKQVGGYLKVEIIPEGGVAKRSEAVGPVKAAVSNVPEAPAAENVKITPPAATICEGDVLIGTYEYFDANGADEDVEKTQKQWYRIIDGTYIPIIGAISEQYTLTSEDVGCDIVYGVKPWSLPNPSVPDDILEGTFSYSEPVRVAKNPVLSDRDALTLGISGKVKSNLVLPAKGENGSVITWKSNNPAVISDSGVVTRGETDVTVTLTATLKHPDREFTATKEFTVVVAKQDANPRPLIEHVYIKQLSGGKLEVQYTLNGVNEADLTYQWYQVDGTAVERDSKLKAISGATQKTYQPVSGDTGKMLLCNVIPDGDQAKAAASDIFGRIIALTGSGKPMIDSEAAGIWAESTRVGDTLYAVYAYQSPSGTPEGDSEIQWLRSSAYGSAVAGFTAIPGATGAEYTLTPEDYGKFITYSVTPKDQKGEAGETVSPWNNGKNNVIYCTPENLLMNAKAVSGSGAYPHSLMGAHRGVRDFRTDQNVNIYYGGNDDPIASTGDYIIDAGREITFDKLVYIADSASIVNIKAEASLDGVDYTEIYSQQPMTEGVYQMVLDEPVTARYIKFVFTRANGKYHAAREVQAFLQPESFSELFAVNLEGAVYDREEKSIIRIPEDTTVAQLKASVVGASQALDVKVLDYTGTEVADNEVVISGYTLVSTSQNGKTTTEYMLSNTDVPPNVVVKTLAAVPADARLGIRVGEMVTAEYELSALNGTPDDTKTAFQWYYSPEENGAYTEIAGAAAKTYTVAEEYLDGYLKVKVEPADGVARTSAAVGPVKPEVSDIPAAPKAENVGIQTEGQTLYAGDTLKGSYEYFDANADEEDKTKTKLQWYREKDGKRIAITEAATDTYQLTIDDEDCNILYSVQPYTSKAEPYAGEIAYSEPVYVTMEPARADFNALTISGISGKVTQNLVLPIRGKNGCVITWESSNPKVISSAGVVKRTSQDEEVTLTATIKHPDRELTMEKVFEDIVVAKKSGGGGSGSSGSGSGGNTGIYIPPAASTPSPNPEDPQTPEDNGNEFGITDMSEGDWAYPYVMDLLEKGVLSKPEDGKFNPKSFLKREEAVKMLVEMFDMLDETAECDFTDVGENDWSYPYIASAYTKQLINGMGDGTFGRGADVTRQDFAVMAYHFLKASGIEKSFMNDAVVFTDASDISDYAKEAVAYLTEAGIINGTPEGAFLPASQITREEAAKIVSGLL